MHHYIKLIFVVVIINELFITIISNKNCLTLIQSAQLVFIISNSRSNFEDETEGVVMTRYGSIPL